MPSDNHELPFWSRLFDIEMYGFDDFFENRLLRNLVGFHFNVEHVLHSASTNANENFLAWKNHVYAQQIGQLR